MQAPEQRHVVKRVYASSESPQSSLAATLPETTSKHAALMHGPHLPFVQVPLQQFSFLVQAA